LERYAAYKKLVDYEKDATLAARRQELAKWRAHALQAVSAAHTQEQMIVDLVMLATSMLYYESPAARDVLLGLLGKRNPAARNVIEEAITQVVAPLAKELEP